MKSLILVIVVALPALAQLGCAFVGPPRDLTPEQAALRVDPPGNGEQRFSALKPAPDGVLVVFENLKNLPPDPNQLKVGYAFVTQQPFGWAVTEGGGISGSPEHSILFFINLRDSPGNRTILYGKTVDLRVCHIGAVFSTRQQFQDAVVNGLFGITVVPKASLCQLELMDAVGQRIELFDLKGRGGDLAELLHGDANRAREECP